MHDDHDHVSEIDLDVTPLDDGPVDPAGSRADGWQRRVSELGDRSRLFRPWPRRYVAVVTAIITGLVVTATVRGSEPAPDVAETPVLVPEDWIIEDDTPESIQSWYGYGQPRESAVASAAAERPPAEITGRVVDVTTLNAVAGGIGDLLALAPGEYDIYVICAADGTAGIEGTVQVSVGVAGLFGSSEYPTEEVSFCDGGVTVTWETVEVEAYTAVEFTAWLMGPDDLWPLIEDEDTEVDIGVAIFIAER